MPSPDTLQIQLHTTQAALDAHWSSTPALPLERGIVAPLSAAGSVRAGFVEPVTAVLTLTLATLGLRLFEHFRRKNERGLQIDLRTQPATLTELAQVPQGFIVLIDADGKASTHRAAYDQPEQVAEWLTKLLGAGR